jgi:hypothetical protein
MDLTTRHPTVDQVHDFSFMLYLAQTCRMITEGGYFKNNVHGSGQIRDGSRPAMWQQAGCSQIFPGFDVDNVSGDTACDERNNTVVGTG